MSVTQFFQQARQLLDDVNNGVVDPNELSDAGKLTLDIAARKVSVNDLSPEGRLAIGFDETPPQQNVMGTPRPYVPVNEQPTIAQRAGRTAMDVTASVIKGLGLDTLAARTGELATGAIDAVTEVPGQLKRGGESFRQAADLALQGQFGHAAAELGGGLAETANAAMGALAPMTIPLAAPAAATGMAVEKGADILGIPQQFNVGAAELSPRGLGELTGMALPGLAGPRAPKAMRMPAITDPVLQHVRFGVMQEAINVREAVKRATGEGTKARLNARAAVLRQAQDELRKGTYSSKEDIYRLLYDNTSPDAQDAAHRTQYVDPYPVQPQADTMRGAAPGVADVAEAQRAEVRATAASVGLDPNQYGGPVDQPAPRGSVETGTISRPSGPIGPTSPEAFPGLREVAPESLEAQVASAASPRTAPESQNAFPNLFGVTPEGAPAEPKAPKGKKGKAKVSEVVQIVKESNPELSTSAAVKVAKETIAAAEKTAATTQTLGEDASISFTNDGKIIVTGGRGSAREIWDLESSLVKQGKIQQEDIPRLRRDFAARLEQEMRSVGDAEKQAAHENEYKKFLRSYGAVSTTTVPPKGGRAAKKAPVVEVTPEQIIEESKAVVDQIVLEDATRRVAEAPPVEQAVQPAPPPTPESTSTAPAAMAPPTESAAPIPAQTRRAKPKGAESALRETSIQKFMKAGFLREEAMRVFDAAQAMGPDGKMGLAHLLRQMRERGMTRDIYAEQMASGGIPSVEERFALQPFSETWAEGSQPTAVNAVLSELKDEVRMRGGSRGPHDLWRPPEGTAAAEATKPHKPSMTDDLRMEYGSANDLLEMKGHKLVISTEADPGKPNETVFLLHKLDGTPVLDETTGLTRSFRSPFAAVEASQLEGPGAMAGTPHDIAYLGLTSDAKSANLMVQKLLNRAGMPQGDLGAFTSHLRLNTPGFVTRFDSNAHAIWSHAVNTDIGVRKFGNALRNRVYEIKKQLANAKEENDLFLMGKVDDMPPEVRKQFLDSVSPNVKRLWQEFRKIDDEIFEMVKRSDPTVRYRKNHISQFPLDIAIENYFDELLRAKDLSKQFPNEPKYQEQVKKFENLLRQLAEQKNGIEKLRFQQQPDGSFFGPLNEARMLNLDYSKSFVGVMEQYISGVERKLLIDRTLPVFKRLIKSDSLVNKPEMRLYLHDWMNGLRGMYGSRFTLALENSLEALGVENPFKRKHIAQDLGALTNIVNGLQSIVYMGLRPKSIINNSFQWLMTGYPEVGARSFMKGFGAAFTKDGWRHARQMGVIDFIPDNLGEMYRQAGDALSTQNPAQRALRLIDVGTTAVAHYTMKPFQFVEKMNAVMAANGGYDYARTVLNLDPRRAAEYGRALSMKTNYIMQNVNTPLAFTGPVGKMGGFLQRFKVNYAEQMWQNYERLRAGDPAPFVRQLGVYLALTGTEGLVVYNLVADQAMKRFGIELPRINPLKWLTMQAGMGSGIDLASSLAVLTPGAAGDLTTIIKPVPVQTAQTIMEQGPAAMVPNAARDVARAFVEAKRGGAQSTTTGKPIANRSNTDVLLSSVALQPWAEGLRNQYLRQIETALQGGRTDVAMRLAGEARQKGLIIKGSDIQAIRESTRRRQRGSSTAGQFFNLLSQ